MGIFSTNPDIYKKIILEADDEDEDYTSGIDTAGDDPEDEETSTEDGESLDTNSEDNSSDDEDYTSGIDTAGDDPEEDTGSEEDSGESSDSSDDEDYTSGIDSAGDESSDDDTSSNENDEESSEDNEDSETEENTEDDTSFENLKKIEAELFSNLTPEQIAIKNYELKQNFINLYSTIGSTLSRINDIAKSDDNIETLKFITDKLLELREMIDFNITKAYQTRTYIENNIIYQQCLSTLNAISDIIQTIPNPVKDKEEKEKEENNDNIVDDLEDSENKETSEELIVSDKMMENYNGFNDYL